MSSSALPLLSSRLVKEVDALAQGRYGISVDWLMEAAGWQVARFCKGPTAVVCGVGNNAGDGLAAARHLHRWGRLASVCCVDPERLQGAAAQELRALKRIGVSVSTELRLDEVEEAVDAIFGTGLSRPPEAVFAKWIEAINGSQLRVIAVDVPSGLDADSGVAYAPCVHAQTTVTLGLPKPGLLAGDGPRVAGEIWVADIGVPFEAYAAVGLEVPPNLFSAADRVRLDSIR
ncbi:MAG TPA: NAD(P)H-hydrate epimerase [Candidatus Dormibacteraeota bacterium]|nr:NAD(P)H-hydrate epimerase [Candidatus Dormibacteraeota bacterium]